MEEGPGVAAEGTGVGRAFDLGDEGGVGAGSFGALSGKAGEGGEVVAGLERGVVGQSERMTKRPERRFTLQGLPSGPRTIPGGSSVFSSFWCVCAVMTRLRRDLRGNNRQRADAPTAFSNFKFVSEIAQRRNDPILALDSILACSNMSSSQPLQLSAAGTLRLPTL